GRQRDPDPLPGAAHAVEPEHGVLEVVVVEVLDLAPEPHRHFGGPDAVGIEAEAVARERGGERTIALQLVARREHAALELVRRESALLLERARLGDQVVPRAGFTGASASA